MVISKRKIVVIFKQGGLYNMEHKMRRANKQMTEEAVQKLLEESLYGVLATVSEDNEPYAVPMNYVYLENKIYMHGAHEGHKISNMSANEKACFTIVGKTELLAQQFNIAYESVVAFGTLEIVQDTKEKEKGLMALVEKYSLPFKKEGQEYIKNAFDKVAVYKFCITNATGKHYVK